MFSCRPFVWLAAARQLRFEEGLVQTNHHCAESCLQGLSGLDGKNYFTLGFYAADQASEPSARMSKSISSFKSRMSGGSPR